MKYLSVIFTFFVVIYLLICIPGYTQNISIGVKGGLSIPNLQSGGSETPLNSGYSSRKGADFGCYVQYDITRLFGMSVGIEYCAEGGKKSGFQAMSVPAEYKPMLPPDTKYLYADFKSEAKLDYLLFPILARAGWNPVVDSSFRIYAALGPFAGLLVSAKQVTSGSGMIYLDKKRNDPDYSAAGFI
ncbi:MAG TPA: outer membrane beta-barrel protein [Spirochaetota bacterium]|nr:outer membrane beta-barrel protein [Spirochaetota bacterium]